MIDAFGGDLGALRMRAVPDLEAARTAKLYYRQAPIAPIAEPLAPAAAFGLSGRNHYAHARNPPYWRAIDGAIDALHVRTAVGERLQSVDRRLRPAGLRLFLFDAWRPRAVQAYFHDVWMPDQLTARDPQLSGEALARAVERYWSAPTLSAASPAPHETGAAIDVTIALDTGEHLFMGSVFDDATDLAATDYYEREDPAAWSMSFEEARANRRLLFWLMREAGFASHPDEWWHYSYGDQFWAAQTGAPAAVYGVAAPPP